MDGEKLYGDAGGEARGPLILGVDTATNERSVAVVRGGLVQSVVEGDAQARGSSSVLADIDEALRQAAVELREIDLFAVTVGPGSFTGLRAGLATIKAFSATLARPAVGVQTVHAVAHASRPAERMIAALPAGRGEVFAQLLSVSADGRVDELDGPVHVAPERLLETALSLECDLKWAGGGARAFEQQMRRAAQDAGILVDDVPRDSVRPGQRVWTLAPDSGALSPDVAALALMSYRRGETFDAHGLRAIYVRASDAELKEQCRPPESPTKEPPNISSTG